MKNNKGITLTSLIVTIIVMVILAGISLYMSVGDSGIVVRTEEAGKKTVQQTDKELLYGAINGNLTADGVKINSVDDLKNNLPEGWIVEQTIDDNFIVTSPNSNVFIVKNVGKVEPSGEMLELAEKVEQSGIELGTLDEIGITDNYFAQLFYIEDGKLVYREEIATESIKEKIEASGIEVGKSYYLIASEETKNSKFAEKENVGTINNFIDIINNGTFANNYKIAFLIENIDMGNRETSDGTWVDKDGNAATSWTPISTYSAILDGQGYKISGFYMKGSSIIKTNDGIIKKITIDGYFANPNVFVRNK